ncbi:hypothetical protein, partial [Leptospira alstonii]
TNGETIAYNVETNIYRTVLNDYMGESGVVSQIFNAELQQRAEQQKQQWNLKEQEFYDLKSDWVQNVSYLKQTGTKRWENMVQEFQGKWKDWRADFKAEHEANQKIYLDRIESTLEKKEAWTKSFLQKSSEHADELTMKEMYDSIAGMVSAMQENLPAGVSMNVNVNDILSSILSKKPGSISASLIDRASSIDTNFFLNEVKKYNFNDSGLKEQFKGLLNTTNKLSQNLIILQTLESLRSLPEAFAKTIKEKNEAAEEELNQTMAYGGFARAGATYIRTIKTASGGDEVQTLGTYQYFNYNPPTVFPEVKDSNGKSWDLGKPELLIDHENVPSASDLTVMVRLAKNKMGADFRKVLDPDPNKRHNYEAEKGLFDPTEVQEAYNEYLDAVKSGESVSCLNKSAEQCAKSAMNSGFLVGEVDDGTFGEAQFAQFYVILKTKKEMDKRKGKMDAARKRKQGGMGRFYNQLGAVAEGTVETVKGVGSAFISAVKANLKATYTGDFNGAKKDLKEAGKQGERALQGVLYATSGFVDFGLFFADTVAEAALGIFTGGILNMQNTGLDGTFAEGNYELAKFRDTNKAQRHINELGMRTGAEYAAQDRVINGVVEGVGTVLAVGGSIVSTIGYGVMMVSAATGFAPGVAAGAAMFGGGMIASAIGTGVLAGWKTFRGAYEGGAAGMGAGIVSGIVNSALDYATDGMIGMNMSYSYANGFGVGVNIGTSNSTQLGGSIGLNYNAKSGAWGASVGLKYGFGGKTKDGYSNWAEAGVHVNNIGRDNQSQGVSATVRGGFNQYGSISQYGSLSLSYDTKAGYGASLGLSSKFGPMSVSPSFNVSEYGGFTTDVQYGFDRSLFNKTNNPNHAAANRNLLDDILNGVGGLVGGIGRGAKSAWDGLSGLFGGGDIAQFPLQQGDTRATGLLDDTWIDKKVRNLFGFKYEDLSNKSGYQYEKDASGKIIGATDKYGNKLSYQYGETGRIESVKIGDKTLTDGGIIKIGEGGKISVVNRNEVGDNSFVYVNGRDTNPDYAIRQAQGIQSDSGREVFLVYNSPSDHVATAATWMNSGTDKSQDTIRYLVMNGKIDTIMGHSEGGAIAGSALQSVVGTPLGKEILKNINYVTFGGAQSLFNIPDHLKSATFYLNKGDFIFSNPVEVSSQFNSNYKVIKGSGWGHNLENYIYDANQFMGGNTSY